MAAVLLVALSVGLDNFAAATALGVSGVDRRLRLHIGLIFGVFEGGMPLVGLLLGHSVAHRLGGTAPVVGGVLLGLTGAYSLFQEVRSERRTRTEPRPGLARMLALGAALSIDNLVIGFALGTYHVDIVLAVVTITIVSTGLSLLGLELGNRLGNRMGQRSGLVGGFVLILLGVLIGTGVL
jgi:putative Mn2+ efflux pump MntP